MSQPPILPTMKELIERGDAAIRRLRTSINESQRLGVQTKEKRERDAIDDKRVLPRPGWRILP